MPGLRILPSFHLTEYILALSLRWCLFTAMYNPNAARFPDEYSHQLFGCPNLILPVAWPSPLTAMLSHIVTLWKPHRFSCNRISVSSCSSSEVDWVTAEFFSSAELDQG